MNAVNTLAESTKAMRKSVIDRDILPICQNRQLHEITANDLHVLDVARVALQVNVAKERCGLPRLASKELEALVQ